jgi:hypothetical protein
MWPFFPDFIFGAEFTKADAVNYGNEKHPSQYVVALKQVEVEQVKIQYRKIKRK